MNEKQMNKFMENIDYVYKKKRAYLIPEEVIDNLNLLLNNLQYNRYKIISILEKYVDFIGIGAIIIVLSNDYAFNLFITKYENITLSKYLSVHFFDTRIDPANLYLYISNKCNIHDIESQSQSDVYRTTICSACYIPTIITKNENDILDFYSYCILKYNDYTYYLNCTPVKRLILQFVD